MIKPIRQKESRDSACCRGFLLAPTLVLIRCDASSRQGGNQLFRVVVLGMFKQFVGVIHFYGMSIIHHHHAVAHEAYHTQVVRNEDVGEPAFLLQFVQKIEDLRLHRYIQSRHRLVADDQPRVDRQGTGDADALPLSARKLVRVTVVMLGFQPHLFQ